MIDMMNVISFGDFSVCFFPHINVKALSVRLSVVVCYLTDPISGTVLIKRYAVHNLRGIFM